MLLTAYSTAMAKWLRNSINQMVSRSHGEISIEGHYNDVIMGAIASQITSLTIVYSTVYSGADQRKHQSSSSIAFVWGIHRWPVQSPHKWPVTRKIFPFDDVIMDFAKIEMIMAAQCRCRPTRKVDISLREYNDLTTSYHESTVRCYAKLENIYYPIGS